MVGTNPLLDYLREGTLNQSSETVEDEIIKVLRAMQSVKGLDTYTLRAQLVDFLRPEGSDA